MQEKDYERTIKLLLEYKSELICYITAAGLLGDFMEFCGLYADVEDWQGAMAAMLEAEMLQRTEKEKGKGHEGAGN